MYQSAPLWGTSKGHNTVMAVVHVGFEHPTSCSRVRHTTCTAEPTCSLLFVFRVLFSLVNSCFHHTTVIERLFLKVSGEGRGGYRTHFLMEIHSFSQVLLLIVSMEYKKGMYSFWVPVSENN